MDGSFVFATTTTTHARTGAPRSERDGRLAAAAELNEMRCVMMSIDATAINPSPPPSYAPAAHPTTRSA